MQFDTSKLSRGENYQLMVQGIIPRPIAWISTIDDQGVPNLAPYSFFSGVSCNPPVLSVSQVTPAEGHNKDTLKNILQTKECVVNIVNHGLATKMNHTSATFAYGVNEFDSAGVSCTQSRKVKPPSVEQAKVRYECELREIIEVSSLPSGGTIILLNILSVYVADELYIAGKIDSLALDAVGKLGGNDYTTTRDQFSLVRP